MAKAKRENRIDAGRAEMIQREPDREGRSEFSDASRVGKSGSRQVRKKIQEDRRILSDLSGGDIDATITSEGTDESPVGDNPTPDQSDVEALGRSVGVTYEDEEPLQPVEKIEKRDKNRWELNPASSEGFQKRMKREGDSE